jgi:hypothetical protein
MLPRRPGGGARLFGSRVSFTRLGQQGWSSELPVDIADLLAERVEFAPERLCRLKARGAAEGRKHRSAL